MWVNVGFRTELWSDWETTQQQLDLWLRNYSTAAWPLKPRFEKAQYKQPAHMKKKTSSTPHTSEIKIRKPENS